MYSSLITKASADYQGTPWLAYDNHFQQMAAITKQANWSQVNSSLWTQYFSNARLAITRDAGLTMIPIHQHEENDQKGVMGRKDRSTEVLKDNSASGYRPDKHLKKDAKWKPYPYPTKDQPICLRWNRTGCRDPNCSYRHICLECHSPRHKLSGCPGKDNAANQTQNPTWQAQGWHTQGQSFGPPLMVHASELT